MSDAVGKLRRLGLDSDEQQGQTQVSEQASVANAQQSPALKLGSLITVGNPKLRSMVEEVRGFSTIEKAILAMVVFESDEVVKRIRPEEWVALIRERVGEEYAEVFRAWLESRGIRVGV
jgi:hypothetical protein